MLTCLTLVVSLAAAGAASPKASPAPRTVSTAENAARARRGLLPRKAARSKPPPRARRIVLLPPARPTLLGEPSGVSELEVVPAVAVAPSEETADDAPSLWASVDGAEVQLVLVRRRPPQP